MTFAAPPGTEPQTCSSCERSSVLGYFDRWGRCPACNPSAAGPPIGGVVYAFLLMGVALAPFGDLEPGGRLAALLAIWPLGLVNTVLHEATHALAARILGWRVHVVAIGAGTPLLQLRLGGTRLVLNGRLLATNGNCVALPEGTVPSRGAIALVTAAPLAAHGVAAAAALPSVSGDSFGGLLAALFAASNVLVLLWSAWPRDIPGRGATDGQTLLDLWRDPDAEIAKWRLAVVFWPYHKHQRDGKAEEALKSAEAVLAAQPRDELVAGSFAAAAHAGGRPERALPHLGAYTKVIERSRSRGLRKLPDRALAARGLFRGPEHEEYMRGSLLVALDRLDEVLTLSERGVAEAASEEARALWQGCVALSLLLAGKDLDRAEEAARWAYERLPWVAFVETAWGMARIERGGLEEGLAAFERARKVDATGGMGALHTAWTAVAHVRRGEREQARMLAESLRAPGVWPACLRRAERAVSGGC